MPDKRKHRGPHPEDERLFAETNTPVLIRAVQDVSAILSMGYPSKGTLKLVCDRFSLTQRQRLAVMRSACSDQHLAVRRQKQIKFENLTDQPIILDGYNVLITIEAALSNGFIFIGRDSCHRDLASVHSTYRQVNETVKAAELIGNTLLKANVSEVSWLLDSPVSNSGKLKVLLAEIAERNNWNWDIQLLNNPDAKLIETERIVATSDSIVLNKCHRWTNLTAHIIACHNLVSKTINLSE
jgi:hypothetical protein